jgi:hypothetical protein
MECLRCVQQHRIPIKNNKQTRLGLLILARLSRMAEEFTLEQLLGGEVAESCHRVRIKGVISHLPPLAVSNLRSVEMLDVSGSCLEDFPQNLSELQRLKILFASSNSFTCAPPLHSLPSLEMLAFRCNRMANFPRTALPQQLRWLILTDNCIEKIPDEIGTSHNFSRAEVLAVN